ncbi:3-methyladenine DNA glycosylase Tag [Bradyrhizobium sp. AZCC 1578]
MGPCTVTAFKTIRARAEKRKGGPKALAKLLPAKPDPKALAKLGDDRILAEMTKRVFCAGFAWSVIESKWLGFEKAFLGFKPGPLTLQPDDFWDGLMKDTRIVRNGAKIMSVRANAGFVRDVAKEHGRFGKFLANWPSSDQAGLLELLAKRGSRLGGNTGQMMLRFLSAGTDSSPPETSCCACAMPGSTLRRRSPPSAISRRCRRSSMPGPKRPAFLMCSFRGFARCRSARITPRRSSRA